VDKSTDVVRIGTAIHVARDGFWWWVPVVVNEHGDVIWEGACRFVIRADAEYAASQVTFAFVDPPPWRVKQKALEFAL